ncbi:hypothetical protein JTE90_001474 [Oedothorax gibbosus]|uniref:EF-hand domain-containing protein n=1 Tax=Oedothorax gibbosus TaxID=931172 RepID=A0AAV6UCA9_9ARAC|nr:hypothetical protein JTE90_001474 [Oedothorax gibbosus]
MWVKRDSKTVFLDLSEYFLNFGFIKEDDLKRILNETKFNEVIKLIPPNKMIRDIQDAFTTLDSNIKGSLCERDIKVTLRALGIEPTSKKIKKLIERVDVGTSGLLSRENYEAIMLHLIHDIDSDEQMMKSFQLFANHESGVITLNDLKAISKQLELNVTDEELQEMIAIADHDKDDKVTQNEFLDTARKIF